MKKIFVLCIGMMGCNLPNFEPPVQPAPRTGTPVEASFTKTWDAVIDIFSERNIRIKTMDRTSGLIVAETNSAVGLTEGQLNDYADCGGYGPTLRTYPNFVTYNILVRGDSTKSIVKANALWEKRSTSQYDLARDCVSKGNWEILIERAVLEIAQRK